MDNEVSNTFYEVQAEKFHQKKVEVARGVIELGKILIETKEGLPHGEWLKFLNDDRVQFSSRTAQRYMKIAKDPQIVHGMNVLDSLSLNKLYTLALAPDEVKEDVVNSKDKEDVEKKIKEYEEQVSQEKLAKESLSIEEVKKRRIDPSETQKKQIRARSHGRCERCGLDLLKYHMCEEFHHINGDSSDTRIDNLQHLCSNCHSIIQYELRTGENIDE